MKRPDDSVDLPSQARRHKLSREEEARLEALLEGSPEERLLYRAGLTFDRESSAREGDDVLIARLANSAARQFGTQGSASVPPSSKASRRRRPVVMLLAAALVAGGTATAGTGIAYFVRTERNEHEVAPPGAGAAPALRSKKSSSQRARATPGVAAPVLDKAPTATVAAPFPVHREAAPLPSARRAAVQPFGAAALFGAANKKRLAGDTAGAIAGYTELARRFPQSPEADLAELSLGKLHLASGNAERALESFRRAEASGGGLGSEALWGQASALRALDRTADERAALERLLTQYSSATYAKAARKRLGSSAP